MILTQQPSDPERIIMLTCHCLGQRIRTMPYSSFVVAVQQYHAGTARLLQERGRPACIQLHPVVVARRRKKDPTCKVI